MARRRYQRGSLLLRGKRERVWVGRWLEDEVHSDGKVHRRHKSEILGTIKDFPTKRLAQRALEQRLAEVNSVMFRPKHTITFGEFAERWQKDVLPNHKPSSQCSEKSHINATLLPSFRATQLKDMTTEVVQRAAGSWAGVPKTKRNVVATLRSMWNTAKAWGYVTHNPFDGLVLPKRGLIHKPVLTAEQARAIIVAAPEPFKTMFWIVAETGIRGGELCGLFVEDIDLERMLIHVRRSAWRGKLQTPKTPNAVRCFPISPNLTDHIKAHLDNRTAGLLFHTRTGHPYDNYNVVTWHLKPRLTEIGIQEDAAKRMGLHAFRHGNASALDSVGAPVRVRMDRLGHADSEMTLGYTHAVGEDHRRIAGEMGRIFDPTLPQLPVSDRNVTGNLLKSVGA